MERTRRRALSWALRISRAGKCGKETISGRKDPVLRDSKTRGHLVHRGWDCR